MSKEYLADTVGKDGTVYPTIGEHIRNSGESDLNADNIVNAVKNNTDRAKIADKLDVTCDDLKTAIVNILTGKTSYFGGLDCDALTSSELSDIKAYLGIV